MVTELSRISDLNGVRQAARELAADFAKRADAHDRDRSAPLENYKLLREAGFYQLVIPHIYGGYGYGPLGWIIAGEELGQGCTTTALSFQMHIHATGLIFENPEINPVAKHWVAAKVIGEGKLICASISESVSSTRRGLTCTPAVKAKRVPGGYLLTGEKAFAAMWEASDFAYLYAHPEGDPNPQAALGLLVPTKAEGIKVDEVWHAFGTRMTRSQTVSLEGVFVPDECVLHQTDAFFQSVVLGGTAWSFGGYTGVCFGLGMGMLNAARRMLKTRLHMTGATPNRLQLELRQRVNEMVCNLEAARLALWQAAWTHETFGPSTHTFMQFVKAKHLVGQAVTRTAHNASVTCGTHPLFRNSALERMIRDTQTASMMSPDDGVLLSLMNVLEPAGSASEGRVALKTAAGAL